MSTWKRFAMGLAVGLLAVSVTSVSHASSTDKAGAIARLEARADALSDSLVSAHKQGVAQHSAIRNHERAIRDEIERLKAGGALDSERVASLLDETTGVQTDDATALANRATERRDALQRKSVAGPKMGHAAQSRVQQEIEDLDSMILSLERGQEVDSARLNALLGASASQVPVTTSERIHESKVKLATLKRQLTAGPKQGVVTRAQLREEIRMIDEMIDQLESQSRR